MRGWRFFSEKDPSTDHSCLPPKGWAVNMDFTLSTLFMLSIQHATNGTSKRHSGPLQDLHLWLCAERWHEATGRESCWLCCNLSVLQYSAGAQYRKWALYCTFTPTSASFPSYHYTQPPVLVSQDAPPRLTTLVSSFTQTPLQLHFLTKHHTEHVLHSSASKWSVKIQYGLL